ncbi:hypothetical protein NSK11_contig00028-0040 [Nocardia seriolae]|uniref:PIN domain-containing protein n=2 Tax=Nocardia seriolae TaxID=37332 RepID=A0ABC9YS66_9NOCA|nr:ribonuclease [Nocardia seriolae]GAP28126.1 hypothetical protein NSK11_contig00028-0040 [Nocardia seriolae]
MICSDLYPDVTVPEHADRWVAATQYRMSRAGEHRIASAIDLIIAATAAHHGLTVLRDDNDFATVARHAPEANRPQEDPDLHGTAVATEDRIRRRA